MKIMNGVINTSEKKQRGGTRKGSGAKPKYNEKTKAVSFKCPISKIPEVKEIIYQQLNQYKNDRQHNTANS